MNPELRAPSRDLQPFEAVPPAPAEVQAQVRRILESRLFSNCQRLARFISFAAQHAVEGSCEQLKESVIGVEVFDRASAYDPRIDPIVRVEARRLRSKLSAYYASVGRQDPVLIEFPKGTYAPIFAFRTSRQLRAVGDPAPSLVMSVVPFASLTTRASDHGFAVGLTEELVHRLTNVGKMQLMHWEADDYDRQRLNDWGKVDALLRGSVRRESNRVRVIAQCIDATSRAYLWSEAYDRCNVRALWAQDIAQAIVTKVAATVVASQPTMASSAGVFSTGQRDRN